MMTPEEKARFEEAKKHYVPDQVVKFAIELNLKFTPDLNWMELPAPLVATGAVRCPCDMNLGDAFTAPKDKWTRIPLRGDGRDVFDSKVVLGQCPKCNKIYWWRAIPEEYLKLLRRK